MWYSESKPLSGLAWAQPDKVPLNERVKLKEERNERENRRCFLTKVNVMLTCKPKEFNCYVVQGLVVLQC